MLAVQEVPTHQPKQRNATPRYLNRPNDDVSAHPNVLEVVRSTIIPLEEGLAVVEFAGHATFTLGRVGAVEEGDVLVANVPEPKALS
jgi:hypothetical protein